MNCSVGVHAEAHLMIGFILAGFGEIAGRQSWLLLRQFLEEALISSLRIVDRGHRGPRCSIAFSFAHGLSSGWRPFPSDPALPHITSFM